MALWSSFRHYSVLEEQDLKACWGGTYKTKCHAGDSSFVLLAQS